MKVSKKELKARSGPLREAFTDFGCIALESVITGRIAHSEAISSLLQLRDLLLDQGGDLAGFNKVYKYFKDHKMHKDTDFSWLAGAPQE